MKQLNLSENRLSQRLVRGFSRKGRTYKLIMWDNVAQEPILAGNDEEGNIFRLPVSVLNNDESRLIVIDLVKCQLLGTSRALHSSYETLSEKERDRLIKQMRDLQDILESVQIYS